MVGLGKEADVGVCFDTKAHLPLAAAALRDLLILPGAQKQKCGVRIAGAAVQGALDLHLETIPFTVSIRDTIFGSSVILNHSTFDDLSLSRTTFTMLVDGDRLKGKNVAIEDSIFKGAATFKRIVIDGGFSISGSSFSNHAKAVSFEGSHIGGTFLLDYARFYRPAKFQVSRDGWGSLHGQKVLFDLRGRPYADDDELDFSGLTVKGSINLEESRFLDTSGVKFTGTSAGGSFILKGSVITVKPGSTLPISFDGVEVARLLDITKAVVSPGFGFRGVRYGEIRSDPADGQSKRIIDFLGKAKYCTDMYKTSEDKFRAHGDDYAAAEVHDAFKAREMNEVLCKTRIFDCALEWARARGGSRWMWAGLASLNFGLLLACCWIPFPRENMADAARPDYSRPFYVLHFILPKVPGLIKDTWRPRKGAKHWGLPLTRWESVASIAGPALLGLITTIAYYLTKSGH